MTVSLPVTLPALPAAASPAATKAAGAAAKGGNAAPGKPAEPGAEHSDVSDMFAALVAALTQQMQPVAEQPAAGQPAVASQAGPVAAEQSTVPTLFGTTGEAVTGEAVAGEAVAGEAVAGTAVAGTAVAGAGTAPATTDAEVPVPVAAPAAPEVAGTAVTTPETELDGVDVPVPAAAIAGEDGGDAAGDGEPAEQRAGSDTAAAKRPAWAGSDAREVRPTPPSGTVPAMPAQPAQGTGPAAPAVAAVPANGADHESRPLPGVGITPATAPANPAAQVEAPATVAAPAAPAADAHVQIARIVRPLRLGDDGAYELALDLTPAELGRVRIDVELRGSTINLHLRADNPATRELLQASLEQLRTELEAAGLTAGSLDIGGRGGSDRPDQGHDTAPTFNSAADDTVVSEPRDREATAVEDTSDGVDVLA